jgi:hypothetical protein
MWIVVGHGLLRHRLERVQGELDMLAAAHYLKRRGHYLREQAARETDEENKDARKHAQRLHRFPPEKSAFILSAFS